MKNGNIQILDIDFEYKLWKNKLVYYKTEIELMIDRSRVVTREHNEWKLNRKYAVLLTTQLHAVSGLLNQIRTQEQEVALFAKDYPITKKHTHYHVHENMRNEIHKIDNRHTEIIDTIYEKLCYPMSDTENLSTEVPVI